MVNLLVFLLVTAGVFYVAPRIRLKHLWSALVSEGKGISSNISVEPTAPAPISEPHLHSCRACGHHVSALAKRCPSCDCPHPYISHSAGEVAAGCLLLPLLFFGGCILMTGSGGDSGRSSGVIGSEESTASPNHHHHRNSHSESAPRTMMGLPSNSYRKHREDARQYLIEDARAAVREGQMTPAEFERWTNTKH